MDEYRDLFKEIEFPQSFHFGEYYRDEKRLLEPLLKAKGYTNIQWSTGESDSFGPLSRVCTCTDKNGVRVKFWYG